MVQILPQQQDPIAEGLKQALGSLGEGLAQRFTKQAQNEKDIEALKSSLGISQEEAERIVRASPDLREQLLGQMTQSRSSQAFGDILRGKQPPAASVDEMEPEAPIDRGIINGEFKLPEPVPVVEQAEPQVAGRVPEPGEPVPTREDFEEKKKAVFNEALQGSKLAQGRAKEEELEEAINRIRLSTDPRINEKQRDNQVKSLQQDLDRQRKVNDTLAKGSRADQDLEQSIREQGRKGRRQIAVGKEVQDLLDEHQIGRHEGLLSVFPNAWRRGRLFLLGPRAEEQKLEALAFELTTAGFTSLPRIKSEFDSLLARGPALMNTVLGNKEVTQLFVEAAQMDVARENLFDDLKQQGLSTTEAHKTANRLIEIESERIETELRQKLQLIQSAQGVTQEEIDAEVARRQENQ